MAVSRRPRLEQRRRRRRRAHALPGRLPAPINLPESDERFILAAEAQRLNDLDNVDASFVALRGDLLSLIGKYISNLCS